jgi:hypothetical protein
MFASPSNPDIWQKRIDALFTVNIPYVREQLPDHLAKDGSVKTLIDNLESFGKQHFDFFFKGFNSKGWDKSNLYPPEYVYGTIVSQIGYDISIFEHIIHQRRQEDETLKEADCLAMEALKPAIAKGWLPANTVALCYYQKFPTIRVIPYANVALIGIPFSCQKAPRDLLSIPHEVGHYVYWRGKVNLDKREQGNLKDNLAKTLGKIKLQDNQPRLDLNMPQDVNKQYQEIPQYALKWTEEIFADVYACLIAGELAAYAGQEVMLSSNSTRELYEDDGEHPPSIIRPSIYHKVLYQPSTDDEKPVKKDWEIKRKKVDSIVESEESDVSDPKPDDKRLKLHVKKDNIQASISEWIERKKLIKEDCELSPWLPVDCIVAEVKKILNDDSFSTTDWSKYRTYDLDKFDKFFQIPRRDRTELKIEAYQPEKEWEDIQQKPRVEEFEWIKFWLYDGWTVEGPAGNPRPPGQN